MLLFAIVLFVCLLMFLAIILLVARNMAIWLWKARVKNILVCQNNLYFHGTVALILDTLEAKTSLVKIFADKNFRHLPKITSLFTDENFNIVFYMRTFL